MGSDEKNPFLLCRAEITPAGQWVVGSDYWSVPAVHEGAASRLCEIIQGAYRAGYKAKAAEIRHELSWGDVDDLVAPPDAPTTAKPPAGAGGVLAAYRIALDGVDLG